MGSLAAGECQRCIEGKMSIRQQQPWDDFEEENEGVCLFDFWGPSPAPGITCGSVWLLFAQLRKSKLLVVVPIRDKKLSGIEVTKQVIAYFDRQYQVKVTIFCSDNEPIWMSTAFQDWLATQGIVSRRTTAGVHQDGLSVLNRTMRIVMERVRALILYDGIPVNAFALAAKHVAFLYNALPPVRGKIIKSPFEHVIGKRPFLGRLHNFGSECVIAIPHDSGISKLEARAFRAILVGYADYQCIKGVFYVPDREGTGRRLLVTSSQYRVLDERLESCRFYPDAVRKGKVATTSSRPTDQTPLVGTPVTDPQAVDTSLTGTSMDDIDEAERRRLRDRTPPPPPPEDYEGPGWPEGTSQAEMTTEMGPPPTPPRMTDIPLEPGAHISHPVDTEDFPVQGDDTEETAKVVTQLPEDGIAEAAEFPDGVAVSWNAEVPKITTWDALDQDRQSKTLTMKERQALWPPGLNITASTAANPYAHVRTEARRSGKPYLLEIFAGFQVVSTVGKKLGLHTVTIDYSPELKADMVMDVNDLDPRLLGRPDFVWISLPCNRSYTPLQHRSQAPPRDKDGTAQSARARADDQLRQKVWSILRKLKQENPNLLYCWENPLGELRKQPDMHHLWRSTTSFCSYPEPGTPAQAGTRKDTDLFTNFKFNARPKCTRTGVHKRHRGQVLDQTTQERGKIPTEMAEHVLTTMIVERQRRIDMPTVRPSGDRYQSKVQFNDTLEIFAPGTSKGNSIWGIIGDPLPPTTSEEQEMAQAKKRSDHNWGQYDAYLAARKERHAQRRAKEIQQESKRHQAQRNGVIHGIEDMVAPQVLSDRSANLRAKQEGWIKEYPQQLSADDEMSDSQEAGGADGTKPPTQAPQRSPKAGGVAKAPIKQGGQPQPAPRKSKRLQELQERLDSSQLISFVETADGGVQVYFVDQDIDEEDLAASTDIIWNKTTSRINQVRPGRGRGRGRGRGLTVKTASTGTHTISDKGNKKHDPQGAPQSFVEAKSRSDAKTEPWQASMDDEVQSFKDHKAYKEVPIDSLPPWVRLLTMRWVYTYKTNLSPDDLRYYKSRAVIRGFEQREGIEYNETESAVVDLTAVKALIVWSLKEGYKMFNLDIKTAFLQASMDIPDIYVRPPEGFVGKFDTPGHQNTAWLLISSVYGLKQSPRLWGLCLMEHLRSKGYQVSMGEPCLIWKRTADGRHIVAVIWVDDLGVSAKDERSKQMLLDDLKDKFEFRVEGELERFLSYNFIWDRAHGRVFIHQKDFVDNLLERFTGWESLGPTYLPCPEKWALSKADMSNLAPKDNYQAIKIVLGVVNSVRWLERGTRYELANVLHELAKCQTNPGPRVIQGCMHLLAHLHTTRSYGLVFDVTGMEKGGSMQLRGYSDASFAGDDDTRKSVAAYALLCGNNVIAHKCKLTPFVCQSTTEAEIIAACNLAKFASWMTENVLNDIDLKSVTKVIHIMEDNEACIHWASSEYLTSRTKHLDYRWHYLKEKVQHGRVVLQYCPTDEMIADIFTKSLGRVKFQKFRSMLGVVPFEVFERGQRHCFREMGWK